MQAHTCNWLLSTEETEHPAASAHLEVRSQDCYQDLLQFIQKSDDASLSRHQTETLRVTG